jgi:hypothetical protein
MKQIDKSNLKGNVMTTVDSRSNVPLMLLPRGGPVEYRNFGAARVDEHRLPTADVQHCYATFARMVCGEPGVETLLKELRDPGDLAIVAGDFDDAARRVSPSNSRGIDRFERAIQVLGRVLDRILSPVIVVPAADQVDAPSLRLIANAWARRPYRHRSRLVLEIASGWPMEQIVDASDSARSAILSGIASGLRANTPPIARGALRRRGNSHGDFQEAVHAFLRRNYEHAASLAGAGGADGLLLKALVSARCNQPAMAVEYLEIMETTATSAIDRARACSTRSVVQAKLGGTAALYDARNCIKRGLDHIGTNTTYEASGQRGWLFNNAGLVEVMDFLKSRDEAAVERAGDWLRKAMSELKRMPSDAFPALHYNVRANAVQWLEMRGRIGEAIDWLDRAFGDVAHPSYLYRRAVLAGKANQPNQEVFRCLETAEKNCSHHEWPYLEHIDRARGYLLFKMGSYDEAETAFSHGLAHCLHGRSATGAMHHATGLVACWNRTGRRGEAHRLSDRLQAEGLPVIDTLAFEPLRPPGKLPPFVPEIDMQWVSRPEINRLINLYSEKAS